MAIKVRVLRGVQAGLAGMSGLVALSGSLPACTAEDVGSDATSSDENELTVQSAGTGVFELAWDYTAVLGYSFSAKNSVDEYVRSGEKMTFALPTYFLWSHLYPDQQIPADLARVKKITAKVTVSFVKDGAVFASSTVATNGTFKGTQTYDLASQTGSFVVNKKATSLRFDIVISDAADKTKQVSITAAQLTEIPVIGASLPNKTALFDSSNGAMRQRILEGGSPVAGANLALGYTDWRAATLIDSSSVDRTIGNATAYGRFGSFQMPILGELEYEITYAVAIDGVWQAEQPLTANAKSRLLSASGRTAYEGLVAVPAGAKKVETYFHVKAFLVVNYDKFTNVGWRKYGGGERLLVREKWDNLNGVANSNYSFPTGKK
jgi:hypothetical protein